MKVNQKNVLLVKDDVGKAKPTTFDLPGSEFAYGQRGPDDQEGAGIGINKLVTRSWATHKKSQKKKADKDFKKLNIVSTKEKATNPKVYSHLASFGLKKSKRY